MPESTSGDSDLASPSQVMYDPRDHDLAEEEIHRICAAGVITRSGDVVAVPNSDPRGRAMLAAANLLCDRSGASQASADTADAPQDRP